MARTRRHGVVGWTIGVAVVSVALVAGAAGMWFASRSRDSDKECHSDSGGGLVAFDAKSGDVLWATVVRPDADVELREGALHAVSYGKNDRVFDGRVDLRSGSTTECITRRGSPRIPRSGGTLRDPVAVGDVTLMGWGDGVRATTSAGTEVWLARDARPLLLADAGLLVESTGGDDVSTALLDTQTGMVKWRHKGRPASEPRPDRPVILVDPHRPEIVTAHDYTTGTTNWSTTLPLRDDMDIPHGTWLGDLVVFNTGRGSRITAVNATDGRQRWTGDGGSPGQGPETPNPGRTNKVLRSPDGSVVIVSLVAFDPAED